MIVERRQVLFSPSALLEAARLYAELPQQRDVPHGMVTAVSLAASPAGPVLSIRVHQSGASQLRSVPLAGAKVLAVLILLCRKRRIPLPRNAEKALAVEGDNLVLSVACSVHNAGELDDSGVG